MHDAKMDNTRALAAAKSIVDGRDPTTDSASIMVTLEHTVGAVLLALYGDRRTAALMLTEELVPGIDERFAITDTRRTQ